MKQATKLDLVHVNYKGGSAAMLALASGEAAAGFVPLATALPLAQSGKVRLLAIAGPRRFPALPDVPTFDEVGIRKFEAASWFGMFAPARTSSALVARLNRDIVEVLQVPSMQQDLLRQGAEAVPTTADDFSAFIRSEITKWREVIKGAGIAPM
jgi:tripartite-type tricarboxylate transporter receptor subunit TctC